MSGTGITATPRPNLANIPDLPVVTLGVSGRKRRARNHPWVFSNELQDLPRLQPGCLVYLHDPHKNLYWTAYYNPHCLIAARVLANGRQQIDQAFLESHLRRAWDYRQSLGLDRNAWRWVHGEADGLPGLVVDWYGGVAVVHPLTAGMEQLLEPLTAAITSIAAPQAIWLCGNHELRELEQLPAINQLLTGRIPENHTVQIGALRFHVHPETGQKGGLFLDQCENNQRLASLSAGRRVLDVCCYQGACALGCIQAGAQQVLAVDISADALQIGSANAALNQISDQVTWRHGNAFEVLKELVTSQQRFDIVHLDPPPFARRKRDVVNALKGYRELHRRSFQLLAPQGWLCSSSCSHHVSTEAFLETLQLAARDVGRTPRVVEIRGQAADHPWLLAAPETRYLSWVLLQLD